MATFDDLAKYNNTSAIHDGDTWLVRLHNTNIFKMVEEESGRVITLNSGGWQTTTTKKRINEAFEAIGGRSRVIQVKGTWYVSTCCDDKMVLFEDGMKLSQAFGSPNIVAV